MGPGVSANPNLSAVIEEDMSEANESLIQKDFVDAPVRRYPLNQGLLKLLWTVYSEGKLQSCLIMKTFITETF